MGRSRWGSVRKLPSGRYQARYQVNGVWRTAPTTFRTKGLADSFLAATRTELERGHVDRPDGGQGRAFRLRRELACRPSELRPRTASSTAVCSGCTCFPSSARPNSPTHTGQGPLMARPPDRGRPPGRLDDRQGLPAAPRDLRDRARGRVDRSQPVRHQGRIGGAAGRATRCHVEQVYAIADAIEPRYRAMVLLATFCGLRVGELRALRQVNLDLLHRTVPSSSSTSSSATARSFSARQDRRRRREVAIPAVIIPDLEAHLATGQRRPRQPGVPRRAAARSAGHAPHGVAPGLEASASTGLRFHDLRHTGNTLAAATGASTKELMARMGHASPRAALSTSTPHRTATQPSPTDSATSSRRRATGADA